MKDDIEINNEIAGEIACNCNSTDYDILKEQGYRDVGDVVHSLNTMLKKVFCNITK